VPKQQIFPIDAYNRAASSPDSQQPSGPRKEPRIVGYTSISHLMHSTSTFPTERMIPVDFKYSQKLSVNEIGDGFIRVISAGDGDPTQGGEPVAIQGIEHSDAEKLIKCVRPLSPSSARPPAALGRSRSHPSQLLLHDPLEPLPHPRQGRLPRL